MFCLLVHLIKYHVHHSKSGNYREEGRKPEPLFTKPVILDTFMFSQALGFWDFCKYGWNLSIKRELHETWGSDPQPLGVTGQESTSWSRKAERLIQGQTVAELESEAHVLPPKHQHESP
jgi:hypothetical protein